MIEKDPRNTELLRNVLGQSFHSESFGGVMAAVEDIQAQFFGERVGPVSAFAGDEGVNSFCGGLLDFITRATSHNPNGLAEIRAAGKEPGRGTEDFGQARG